MGLCLVLSEKYIAGGNTLDYPRPAVKNQAAIFVDACENPDDRTVGKIDCDFLPDAGRCRSPALDDGDDALTAVPERQDFGHRLIVMGEKLIRRNARSFRAKTGDRVETVIRQDGDIDAAADDQRLPAVCKPLALQQDAAGFFAADHHVVRPLDRHRIATRRHDRTNGVIDRDGDRQRQRAELFDRCGIDQ